MKSDFKERADLPCGEWFFVLRQMKNHSQENEKSFGADWNIVLLSFLSY